MGLVTIGLKKLEIAPLAADGGPGTVFTEILTTKGTFSFNEDDPTVKRVEVEQKSNPLKTFRKAGAKSIVFNIPDGDVDLLALIRGGVVTAAAGKKTYLENEPISYEGTIRITPEEGFEKIQYNSVSIFGKMNGGLGAEQELTIEATADIQQPSKAGVAVLEIVQDAPAAV